MLLWEGVVYGFGEAILLAMLPVLAVWQATSDRGWTQGGWPKVAAGAMAIAGALLVILIHHLGYSEFRARASRMKLAETPGGRRRYGRIVPLREARGGRGALVPTGPPTPPVDFGRARPGDSSSPYGHTVAHNQGSMPLQGSATRKIRVRLNGAMQGMFIQGESPGKPVLLFVHGGPGMPEYWLTQRYPFHLDELFTVAWWEQRGSGLSYEPGIPAKEMTSERFVADTLAVSNHLRDRSGTEKIYLMAHSWGSYIGLQAAAQAPALYHAYVGVAQITHQIESEALAYEYMLQQYRKLGQTKMVRRLEAAPVTPTTIPLPASYDAVRDRAMHGLGVGTTRDMKSVVTGLFLPSWRFPEYTLREKANLWRGKIFSRRSGLWNRMLEADLTRRVPALGLPAYFLHGRHDYTVSYVLSRAYAQHLVAPLKGFYTFENSAHSPMFEEPERTLRILREDVLPGRNHLADPE